MPDVDPSLQHAFERYERALVANDVDALDSFFVISPSTIRFGVADAQYGSDAIAQWRRTATPVPADRRLARTDLVALGEDVAVVSCQFVQAEGRQRGRQSQVWVRTDGGWRIAHAHVSVFSEP